MIANTNLHPSDLIADRLGLTPTHCYGVYGDLMMLLRVVKAASPAKYDPEYSTPVCDFLSRLSNCDIPTDCVPFGRTAQLLSELQEKYRVSRSRGR